jgi:hypothetical protein
LLNNLYIGHEARNTNECLSARIGKSIQHAYQIVSLIQTVEIGFKIYKAYLEIHHQFPPDGVIDVAFIDEIQHLFRLKYSQQFTAIHPQPFTISKEVTLRAIDLISCNMRQFALLFDNTNAPKIPSMGRQIIVVSPDQQQTA